MKRFVAAVAAVSAVVTVLPGCGGGGDGSSAPTTAPSTRVTVAPSASMSASPSSGPLGAWLADGQEWLTELATAAEGLRNVAPDSPANAGIMAGVADRARQAAAGFRSLPPPATGRSESAGLVGALDELDAAARSASTCTSACGPAYTTVLTAQQAFTEALRRAGAAAQAGG